MPGTPTTREELSRELKPLCQNLKVPDVFEALSVGLHMTTEKVVKEAVAYILVLDSDQKTVRATGYTSNEHAAEDYITLEKENLGKTNIQTVLVSVDSLASLRKAYPSYYLDTKRFTKLVNELVD